MYKPLILCLLLGITSIGHSSDPTEINLSSIFSNQDITSKTKAGVAVSPAHLRFDVNPGNSEMKTITVNNDTDKSNSFKASFNDFNMNGYGKSEFLPAGSGEYSLSRWVAVSPSYVDLKPGEKVELTVTVLIPEDHPDANKAAWSILLIEQAEERKSLEQEDGEEKIAFGVIPTFAFGVFLYQNPPNVEVTDVDIIDVNVHTDEITKSMTIDVENKGDGISYCTVYVDLTNLDTGETEKLAVKKFTIVPGLKRAFNFPIPLTQTAGNYSAVSVLDFGSDVELEAAEIEFKL
ncbi:MAG: hypothetical protein AB8B53_15085 [Flavobacteriales bacterium]